MGAPSAQSRMWSHTAFAADAAELALRAAITAAPRFWTVGSKVADFHSASSVGAAPFTLQWETSGYCVDEWLPQM